MTQCSSDLTSELLVSKHDGVLLLTLNRPARRNALSPTLYEALLDALLQAASERSVGAVVLTGAQGAFCAGGDVARMAGTPVDELSNEEKIVRLRRRNEITELLHSMPKPTIAMISGVAVGAGLSLALACDLRIADTSARFKTAFVNVGLSGDFGGHYFLPRLVGVAKARELYMLSPLIDADHALALGLVNQVLPPEALHNSVMAMAEQLSSGPRVAIAHMKANLNYALNATLAEVLDEEAWRHTRCTETFDHKEATRAFVEKRKPVFVQSIVKAGDES
jgi:2-(1,2-epoxy-1,2-dihydrophenyl)acetyl-CoA isomerase